MKEASVDLKIEKAVSRRKKGNVFKSETVQLLLLCMPAIILVFVFSYIPMIGIILPFKRFQYDQGIFGSEWIGLENFMFFFKSDTAWVITRNTLLLNALFIFLHTIVQVGMAMFLYEIQNKRLIKTFQSITILPSFVSWVIVGCMSYLLLNPELGIINQVLGAFGIDGVQWYSVPKAWPGILAVAHLWKGTGINLIIYYAALIGIDTQYYEAADLDGATKWQKTIHISVPELVPQITILTILAIGNIFRADFGMFYQLTRNISILYPTTDVIDTYVYRCLKENGNIGMSSAVSFLQSVVGFILVLATNLIVKRKDPDRALF